MPRAWRRHGRLAGHVAEAVTVPKGMAASAIEAYGNLECAVNVSYGDNWLSTSSHFCNLGDTFRASVFCGQAIDLNGGPGPIRTGDPLLRRQMLYPTELRARAFILSAQ